MITIEELEKMIEKVEDEIKKIKINILSSGYLKDLLEIHIGLWDLKEFKKNEKEN